LPLNFQKVEQNCKKRTRQKIDKKGAFKKFKRAFLKTVGAGNEARTRDLNLGKVALYQLSYSRAAKCNSTS
jgi:hypothetical protein